MLKDSKKQLQKAKVEIYVRRGGPNYQDGLRQMAALESELGIPVKVFGPETHITHIVPMALSK